LTQERERKERESSLERVGGAHLHFTHKKRFKKIAVPKGQKQKGAWSEAQRNVFRLWKNVWRCAGGGKEKEKSS